MRRQVTSRHDEAVDTDLAISLWPLVMSITATIMNAATGAPIQTMKFGRTPRIGAGFVLATGERVTAQRIDIGKPAPGKFVSPVEVWVVPKS